MNSAAGCTFAPTATHTHTYTSNNSSGAKSCLRKMNADVPSHCLLLYVNGCVDIPGFMCEAGSMHTNDPLINKTQQHSTRAQKHEAVFYKHLSSGKGFKS